MLGMLFPGDWAATSRLDGGDARILVVLSALPPGVGCGTILLQGRLHSPSDTRLGLRPAREDWVERQRVLADAGMGPQMRCVGRALGRFGALLVRVSRLGMVDKFGANVARKDWGAVDLKLKLLLVPPRRAPKHHHSPTKTSLPLGSPVKRLSVSATL